MATESLLPSVSILIPRSFLSAVATVLATVIVSFGCEIIYNLYFHPLAKIPGPKFAAISEIWITKCWTGGFYPHELKKAHDKYGPVLRVGPNEVSFTDPAAWKDIHGQTSTRKAFQKSIWYDAVPGDLPNLVTAREPIAHAHMRKTLSHGFSAKALTEQEGLIHILIDKFIGRVWTDRNSEDVVDIVKWFDYATFDIIGDLSFGEPFGSLETGELHFWIALLFGSIKAGSYYRALQWWPNWKKLVDYLYVKKMLPGNPAEAFDKNIEYAHQQLQKRIKKGSDRIDFLGRAIAEREKSGTPIQELEAHAQILVLAGSETTSTAMSGIIHYLSHNRRVYDKLAGDVREAFKSYDQITAQATENIPYLRAVIEEGLRVYPPLAFGLPRISPGAVVAGVYLPAGTTTYVNSYAANHSELYFKNPQEFIPERWIDPSNKDNREVSQPFLLGPRGCLGRNLAMVEMRLILSKLLWTFDYTPGPGSDDWLERNRTFVVWQKPALDIKVTRREDVFVPPLDGKISTS